MSVKNPMLAHHISSQFNEELQEANAKFMSMGGLIEQQVTDAMHSLLDNDIALAIDVQYTETTVNRLEREIDECLTIILARRHPAAIDLRMVIAMSKANTDLERIGDEANKIATISQSLSEERSNSYGFMEARHIGNQVRVMIHEALDAFARLDTEQALKVLRADVDTDREYQAATRTLMTYMIEDARQISRVLNVLWVLRSLERIGDHARNIAEQVIYIVKGLDVRHASMDEIEKKVHDD
ncbi:MULTISPECIES: phosphate signaling complex protein PhoU [Acinetobacter]|uniref:Phosphate-specific transport system accessory protein PhoU n=2 Tax=Gammaproteobacteria TaxID=1236 RepID=A0ABU6DUG2_9GAMM|nr:MULTISPECIES: phosphate signaling complex protein PhoU [Acinetobacter]MBF7690011.1 phosphate signaling complex protein PhoU [Acinetobacter pollinis]MBF7692746.1 phosphate signaling complex protein PhoU [Acinetobacter pollinis]MBF7697785.1 phosphate signaling complex protein PhoU [Acinetobacter pollinis]MBF7700775.1 phosphate signaling complex protein PhoU [Acinetobacter pollinis]MEB5476749.1 phosphate signaling complex protein PhoU [Acinetobacter pollinis]